MKSMENYFSTFEQICEKCNNWKIHHLFPSNPSVMFQKDSHLTCKCHLILSNSVCCEIGLEQLILKEPEVLKKMRDIPRNSNLTRILYAGYINPLLEDQDLFQKCKNVILRIINNK